MAPQPCPAGTFGNATGASNSSVCLPCPAGFYCEGSSHNEPTGPCSAGYYCTGGASMPSPMDASSVGVFACAAGSFSLAGAVNCTQCPLGTYQNFPHQAGCLPCKVQYFCPSAGTADTGSFCLPGGYCPGGAVLPVQCAAGTYQPAQGAANATSCVPCDGGSYCATSGLSAPTGLCSAGFFCGSGSVAPDPGNSMPASAGAGPCPAGHYCDYGTATPAPCPPGSYMPATGAQSSCTPCTPGKVCAGSGLTAPSGVCPAGNVCAGGNANGLETPAPPGFFAPAGASSATPCAAGTYTATAGRAACDPCPARAVCGPQTSAPADCGLGLFCPNGTAPGGEGRCPAGTLGTRTRLASAAECAPCPAGSYCNTTGLTAPTGLCGPGAFCAGGAAVPRPDGSDATGGPCAAGFVCQLGATASTPVLGSTGIQCPTNYYCPQGAQATLPCAAGTFSDVPGLGACKPCTAGDYCS